MSGLDINYEKGDEPMDMYEIKERLALTAPDENGEQRLVPEGDAEARWLYAIPGALIPLEEAIKYGLLADGEAQGPDAVEQKPKKKRGAA